MLPYRFMLKGSCHCGQVQLKFSTNQTIDAFSPRACDCTFCRKHGASYVSDPDGKLVIQATTKQALSRYQQGSLNATFYCCQRCGVLMAVVFHEDQLSYAAVNTRCIDNESEFKNAETTSPQSLSEEEKIERWKTLWIKKVIWEFSKP